MTDQRKIDMAYIDELKKENKSLKRFKQYAGHKLDCKKRGIYGQILMTYKCTCGLDDLLEELK